MASKFKNSYDILNQKLGGVRATSKERKTNLGGYAERNLKPARPQSGQPSNLKKGGFYY